MLSKPDFDSFFDDDVLRTAVIHWLTIIGQAARYVSDETKNKHTEIEWKKMIGMRNISVHKYFDIDYIAIWQATLMLDDIRTKIQAIQKELK